MKNFRNIFIVMFLCGVLQAQETTLAEKAEVRGGFGSPFFCTARWKTIVAAGLEVAERSSSTIFSLVVLGRGK